MRNRWPRMSWLLLLISLVGCRGCSDGDNANAKVDPQQDPKKKKQRLVADELRTLPYATETPANMVKPGHWYQVRNKLKANLGDESLTASVSVTNREGDPIPAGWGTDSVDFKRNVALAVGQEKAIDVTIYHPPVIPEASSTNNPQEKRTTIIQTRFAMRGIGTPILEETFPSTILQGFQYDLVVTSRDISRHTFWRGLDCIVWRRSDDLQENRLVPHRIVDIQEDELSTHLPSRLATLTSISHLVINDASLAGLTQEQQLALADWLHFGGTIIINGPEAVGVVETSQLKDWVPLVNTSDVPWSADEQEQFDQTWSIRIAGGERIPFQSDRPMNLLKGELSQGAAWVPSLQGLVAERLIGQGRVVMTTFPMTDAAFLRWPSYSSLIHNALLRKPNRTPTVGENATTLYSGDFAGTERNPIHSTRLRLWARDLDLTTERSDDELTATMNAQAKFPIIKQTSLGAWNANSRIQEHATSCLRESSGITVPRIGTIIKLLLAYLAVLVPINWAVFRLAGRVELAWVAAPLIALIGAAFVARSVQLDVGFSRSQTSFGFLEVHNDYPRGLLSNYYALYTSLSTNYQAVYKDSDGLVAPVQRIATRAGLREQQALEYWSADDRGAGLQAFPVLSNSTGILQSEEMVDMSGSLQWRLDFAQSKIRVTNGSQIAVRDIGVLGIDEQGQLVMGWIGSLEPGQSSQESIRFAPESDRWFANWDANPLLKRPVALRARDGLLWTDQPVEDVYMGVMLLGVAQRYPLQRGEAIALGWTDANPSKLQIAPSATQKKHNTVLLMHISPAQLGAVEPDTRIFARLEEEEK